MEGTLCTFSFVPLLCQIYLLLDFFWEKLNKENASYYLFGEYYLTIMYFYQTLTGMSLPPYCIGMVLTDMHTTQAH
uniref:Uncharacterized protein n=1 Tax=Arundo donax TaxID=35708 RepID=A0A0A9A4Y1_ARUDO